MGSNCRVAKPSVFPLDLNSAPPEDDSEIVVRPESRSYQHQHIYNVFNIWYGGEVLDLLMFCTIIFLCSIGASALLDDDGTSGSVESSGCSGTNVDDSFLQR